MKNNMITLNMNINTQPARTDDKVSLFINMNTLLFEKNSETTFFCDEPKHQQVISLQIIFMRVNKQKH